MKRWSWLEEMEENAYLVTCHICGNAYDERYEKCCREDEEE